MVSTVHLLETIKTRIEPVAGECALSEAELILVRVLQRTRSDLYTKSIPVILEKQKKQIETAVVRRLTGEPLPYILGTAYFHSKDFLVSKAVLIPRPDTEILVEKILEIEPEGPRSFIDIGIGSGAIAEALICKMPLWKAYGIDISEQALKIAKINCNARIGLVCGDLFSAFKPVPCFDFIVSNPPYISEKEMAELDQSVKGFEPLKALYGGKDGLDFYRVLSEKGKDMCTPGGRIYCETGHLQGEDVRSIFSGQGWKNIRLFRDLAGRPRVVTAHL